MKRKGELPRNALRRSVKSLIVRTRMRLRSERKRCEIKQRDRSARLSKSRKKKMLRLPKSASLRPKKSRPRLLLLLPLVRSVLPQRLSYLLL